MIGIVVGMWMLYPRTLCVQVGSSQLEPKEGGRIAEIEEWPSRRKARDGVQSGSDPGDGN